MLDSLLGDFGMAFSLDCITFDSPECTTLDALDGPVCGAEGEEEEHLERMADKISFDKEMVFGTMTLCGMGSEIMVGTLPEGVDEFETGLERSGLRTEMRAGLVDRDAAKSALGTCTDNNMSQSRKETFIRYTK